MNKMWRMLLLAVVIFAMVVPMAVSAGYGEFPPPNRMGIPGKIFNGNNGGPESPVTVRLYRNTGGSFQMIREETFAGQRKMIIDPITGVPVPDDEQWDHTFSAMGDFYFEVNAVQGMYRIEIEEFLCSDGSAATDTMWYKQDRWTSEKVPQKQGMGGPGPWTFDFYFDGLNWPDHQGDALYLREPIIFEYGCLGVAGAEIRDNAGWMYVAGKVFFFDREYKAADGFKDPYFKIYERGVPGVHIWLSRVRYDQNVNTATPWIWERAWHTVTGDRGFYGFGITRTPGFYQVMMDGGVPTALLPVASATQLYFQVFDVYAGSPGYGPGSSWLPWNYMQPDWTYDNLNFLLSDPDPMAKNETW